LAVGLAGCAADPCEALCGSTGAALQGCFEGELGEQLWHALDAEDRSSFEASCSQRWSAARAELEPRELSDGLEQCAEAQDALAEMQRDDTVCDQLRALYL
jgi:hypothetical protein